MYYLYMCSLTAFGVQFFWVEEPMIQSEEDIKELIIYGRRGLYENRIL